MEIGAEVTAEAGWEAYGIAKGEKGLVVELHADGSFTVQFERWKVRLQPKRPRAEA